MRRHISPAVRRALEPRRRTTMVAVIVVLLAHLVAAVSSAPATAASTLTFSSIADTYVKKSAPTKKFGAATKMWVDSKPSMTSFVRFEVAGTGGLDITGARLRLFQTDSSKAGGRVSSIAPSSWSEATTTYNNRPRTYGDFRGSFGTVAAGNWYDLDLGSIDITDGPIAFAIDSSVPNDAKWATRESANDPQLLIDVDDPPPTEGPSLGVNDVTLVEGDAETTDAVFTIALSEPSLETVTVNYATRDGTATAGTDYIANSGSIELAPSETSETIVVTVTGDTKVEPVETFFVDLSGSSETPVADAEGLGTITTDDVVTPTVETPSLPGASNEQDVADDPAIWVHPSDPALSLVVGTNKSASQGGLAVYDMNGQLLQYLAGGSMNNVDIATGFTLGTETVDLAVATNRSDNTLAVYKINDQTRSLENIAARPIPSLTSISGICMYRGQSGRLYAFVTQEGASLVQQVELSATAEGLVDGQPVRTIDLGATQSESCVADDESGDVYFSDETENGAQAEGIRMYDAEPDGANTGTLIAKIKNAGGELAPDVEGLAIISQESGAKFLIASSQGDSTYAVYRLEGDNAHVLTFTVQAAGTIDAVTETDGLDAVSTALGSGFPHGALVVHDHVDGGGTTSNYKFVPLERLSLP